MNTGQIAGIVFHVLAVLIGLLLAAFGVYHGIKNTRGPKERAFMARAAVWFCVGVVLLVVLVFALPHPYKSFWLVLYVPAMFIFLVMCGKRQARISEKEAQGLAQQKNMAQTDAAQGGESAGAPSPPVS